MYVHEFMSRDVITLSPEESVFRAKELLHRHRIRHLPVVDESGALVGIVSQTDLLAASLHLAQALPEPVRYLEALQKTPIGRYMKAPVITVTKDHTVERAALLLRVHRIGCLPVVEEGLKVVGILTETDVYDILIEALGWSRGGARMVFDLPPGEEDAWVKRVLLSLEKDALHLTSLSVYQPREPGGKGRLVVRVGGDKDDAEEIATAPRAPAGA